MGVFARSLKNIANAVRGVPAVMLANLLLTRRCTQRCLQCGIPLNPGDPPFMAMDDFRALIDRFDRHGTQFIGLSGGEPLMHPQVDECIRYAGRKGFVRTQMLTTLYAPKPAVEKAIEAVLDVGMGLQVSFDGFGDVADRIRGAKNVSRTVQENMELLTRENARRKKPIRTWANVVMSRQNLHQIGDILDYVGSLGWKCTVSVYRWHFDNARESDEMKLEPGDEFLRTCEMVANSPVVMTTRVIIDGYPDAVAGRMPKRCPYLQTRGVGSRLFVNPNGSADVCIGEPMGNLIENSTEELFRSEEWKERLREMEKCRGCWSSCYTHPAIMFHPQSMADLKAIMETIRTS